jgi:ubiquinone/menaquinone biosynthesis C-methylase UbiE
MSVITHQQRFYETAYDGAGADLGFPDPKIAGDEPLINKRILTLGGGTANDLWHLARQNLVVNADYATSGLRVGKRSNVQGVSADLNSAGSLPFADRTFDCVVCKDILEHLLEPLVVLKEAVRVLHEDGVLIISVPNHFYWPMRIRLMVGKGIIWRGLISDHGAAYHEWNYMHIRFFTYKGFRRFLAAAGLTPVRFYWDFGNLAHYHNPDMWFEPQLQKRASGLPLSRRAKFGLYVLRPAWQLLNVFFPRSLRSAIVSLCPGLLCGGFYVHCRTDFRTQSRQEAQ